jgi:hypothetical protein
MSETKVFAYEQLGDTDLAVDAVYKGDDATNLSAAPLPKLLDVGTTGGFRWQNCSTGPERYSYIVLFTTLNEPDWPDHLDAESGIFTYYGDNREPGSTIHEKRGNEILRDIFDDLHSGNRSKIPPVLVFSSTGEGYDRQFRGLAVPGHQTENQSEDLVAIWKHKEGNRFQNYRAAFTILDVERIPRAWISDLQSDNFLTENTPDVWAEWRQSGRYTPLRAERTREHRGRDEQTPSTERQKAVLEAVYSTFEDQPTEFEDVAAALFELMDSNVGNYELTRRTRDGGRDATGTYVIKPDIGPDRDSLSVDFALEAKCYEPNSAIGVRETSRLISRLRHRQFGVFVTTSYVGEQAYTEIKQDDHPVLVLSGGDIAKILIGNGLKTEEEVKKWLNRQADS